MNRQFVKAFAVTGGVTAVGSLSANASSAELETTAVSQAEVERVFESQAAGVLKTLASEGLLAKVSLDELPTSQMTTDP